ncbi:MAG: leucyl aminopeptidase [Gammaproteobacteria bacterium]|nr:leucyl aminopeptidase [Gammaproteobacteria bacterium]
MELTITTSAVSQLETECLIIAVDHDKQLTASGKAIDKITSGLIKRLLKQKDISGELATTLLLPHFLFDEEVKIQRILLIGCGDTTQLDIPRYRKMVSATATVLKQHAIQNAVSTLHEIKLGNCSAAAKISQSVLAFNEPFYCLDQFKSQRKKSSASKSIALLVSSRQRNTAEQELALGQAISAGSKLCKDLANLPPNHCTPRYLARRARQLANQTARLQTKIVKEADMKKLGMGALLSVAQGSSEPPQLIVMRYSGGKRNEAPVALIGKGITFDSGGLDLKSPAGMAQMKYDMAGGAAIFGTLQAAAMLNLPLNIVGIIAASENLVNGQASRPSDIVSTMSGLSVEIMNTDAEGRLVLCDALTYCQQFKPHTIIDVATLTGAAVVALGHEMSTLFGNHQPLVDLLQQAGNQIGDSAWQLPITEEAHNSLKSVLADLKNVPNYGNAAAKAIVAAAFLSRFTETQQWAHLDVAGSAFGPNSKNGASGRPVPLLTQYLLNLAQEKVYAR